MHQFKFLGRVTVIFCFVLAVLGCVTNKGVNNKGSEFSFTTEATPEGVIFIFNNIPEDAIQLYVSLGIDTENGFLSQSISFWDNELIRATIPEENMDGWFITQNELAELKENPKFLFPFAQNGHEYIAYASIATELSDERVNTYFSEVTATGGIHLTNSPILTFCEEERNLILSEKPVFSEEVDFYQTGAFAFGIDITEFGGIHTGPKCNDLICPANDLINGFTEYYELSGDYTATGMVMAYLVHRNLVWITSIAQTDEFTVTF